MAVEQAGERVRGGADAGEVHAAEVKIRRQAVVLREHAVIAALRERQQSKPRGSQRLRKNISVPVHLASSRFLPLPKMRFSKT